MLRKILGNSKGFSLVELIVVIAIMVILVAMVAINVLGYINKANTAAAKKAAQEVYQAAVSYVYSVIDAGNALEPNSDIDVAVLWSDDVQLIKEIYDYDTIEIKVNDGGTSIKYVYYKDQLGHEVDYPFGASGKLD